MKPETMLVAYELPFHYYSDNSLTAPINWSYSPDYKTGNIPYALFYLTVRGNSSLKQLDPNIEVVHKFRSLEFHGNTSNMIVIYQPENGCLRILDRKFYQPGYTTQAERSLTTGDRTLQFGQDNTKSL